MGHDISLIQKTGYTPVAAFALSENCWTDNYFTPQEAVNEMFLKKYAGNKTVEAFISNMRHEAELYSNINSIMDFDFLNTPQDGNITSTYCRAFRRKWWPPQNN
jgi:hypothetical protein